MAHPNRLSVVAWSSLLFDRPTSNCDFHLRIDRSPIACCHKQPRQYLQSPSQKRSLIQISQSNVYVAARATSISRLSKGATTTATTLGNPKLSFSTHPCGFFTTWTVLALSRCSAHKHKFFRFRHLMFRELVTKRSDLIRPSTLSRQSCIFPSMSEGVGASNYF